MLWCYQGHHSSPLDAAGARAPLPGIATSDVNKAKANWRRPRQNIMKTRPQSRCIMQRTKIKWLNTVFWVLSDAQFKFNNITHNWQHDMKKWSDTQSLTFKTVLSARLLTKFLTAQRYIVFEEDQCFEQTHSFQQTILQQEAKLSQG